ncbi:MAG: GAF domain-containing protein, partial [Deltaproteobacteria bacterium]|nr:GAF domain-containing protein [Deltaproteobacteria bacterium]
MATSESTTTPEPRRRRTGEVRKPEPAPAEEAAALREQVAALDEALAAKDRRIAAMKEIGRALGAILDLDEVLALIMKHVTVLLEADRSTMYLVDPKSRELWSKIAQGDNVQEIRLPMGVGLAGWVAKAGQPLNLRDVYQDKRFNKAVDQRTGYRTQNMLA